MNAKQNNLAFAIFVTGAMLFATTADTEAQRRRRRRPVRPIPTKPVKKEAPKKDTDKKDPKFFAVVNATIHTGTGIVIPKATLLLKDDKIEAVGANVFVPKEAKTFDAKDMHLCPGVVGMRLNGVGLGGRSKSYGDVLNPYDYRIQYALACGITSSVEGRPSSTNCVIKMTYGTLDGMLLAENTRVGMRSSTLTSTRRTSREGKRKLVATFLQWKRDYRTYQAKAKGGDKKAKAPKVSSSIAPLVAAYKGDAKLWISGARSHDQLSSVLDFLDQVNVPAIFDSPVEGWTIAPRLGRANCMAVVAPRTDIPKDKKSMTPNGSNIRIAAILNQAGVPVACIAAGSRFSNGINFMGLFGQDQQTPFNEAAFAVRGGLDQNTALASVTRIPAIMAGVEHRVGTLEIGKDADFIILNGNPLHYQALVEFTYINGKRFYNRKESPIYKDVPKRDPGPK